MRGRIRIAAVGVAAVALACALSASAGAATTPAHVEPQGRRRLRLAQPAQQRAGLGRRFRSGRRQLRPGRGPGHRRLRLQRGHVQSRARPVRATSAASLSTPASSPFRRARAVRPRRVPPGSSNCAVPAVKAAPLLSLGPACGSATASEDANGNPTAEGHGQPGRRPGPHVEPELAAAVRASADSRFPLPATCARAFPQPRRPPARARARCRRR